MADEKKYEEKEEKQFDEKNEKELQKHEEKVEQQDMLSSLSWAFILIWAGFVFLALNLGWMETFFSSPLFTRWLPDEMVFFEPGVWTIIMFGAGIILLLETAARLIFPQFHRHIGGSLITGVVFIGIGLGNFFGWDIIWPLVLIAAGVSVLVGGFARRR